MTKTWPNGPWMAFSENRPFIITGAHNVGKKLTKNNSSYLGRIPFLVGILPDYRTRKQAQEALARLDAYRYGDFAGEYVIGLVLANPAGSPHTTNPA